MKKFVFLNLIFAALIFGSCKYNYLEGFYRADEVWSRVRDIEILTPETNPKSPDVGTSPVYSVVLITDVHFGENPDRADEQFIEEFKKLCESEDEILRPKFLICLGDVVDLGKKNYFDRYINLCEKIKNTANTAYGISDFQIYTEVGNHDLYNAGWKNFEKMIYPYTSYFKFETKAGPESKGMSWYFLDTGNGALGRSQIFNFKQNVYKDDNPKIILTHYPIYSGGLFYFTMQNTDERNALLDIFARTNTKFIAHGHHHPGSVFDYKKFVELGIKSYLDYRNFCLLTVDEKNGSVTYKEINF